MINNRNIALIYEVSAESLAVSFKAVHQEGKYDNIMNKRRRQTSTGQKKT